MEVCCERAITFSIKVIWRVTYATRNKSAKAAADCLFNDFVLWFGFPTKILHDQGREFENKLFHRLEQLSGVTRLQTTPYHPQGNGKVERFNRTLLHMLRTLPESQRHKWKDSLNKVVHAYNSSRSDATGFSPFYLLFGRSPRLPVDLMFGLSREDTRMNHAEYTEKWKVAMQDAYDLASRISRSQQMMERGNMIGKYGSPVYNPMTECWYVTSLRVVVLENLGLIGNKKYIS